MSKKICVLGSGAWGTAIASALAENGNEVCVYGVCEEEVDDIRLRRRNVKYFGENYRVHDGVSATTDFDAAAKGSEIVVLAIPSGALRGVVKQLLPYVDENTIIVNLAKGFDKESGKTLGQFTRELLPFKLRGNVVSLLGPSYAVEVAEKQFTAITVSGTQFAKVKEVQRVFTSPYFHLYANNDPVGSEYCAALKNVIALACGIADGLGYKVNTKAAIITRGLAEIVRFVTFFGGNEKTCYGLAGVGDLYLTCSSTTSRNYSAGYAIGKSSYKEFALNNTKTVEGVTACEFAYKIAKENNIYAPIISAVYSVTYGGQYCTAMADALKITMGEKE